MIRRMIRFATVSALALTLSFFIGTSNVSAWGHHHHHHHHGIGWGGFGYGGCYSSYYSTGYYPISSVYFGSYIPVHRYASFHSFPIAAPYYYAPRVYFAPVYYTPPVVYSTYIPLCSTTTSQSTVAYTANRSIVQTNQSESIQVNRTPSYDWLASATELIDSMASQGGSKEGLDACEQLMKVRDELPSGIYLRAAVFAASESKPTATVLKYLTQAQQRGSKLNGTELPGGSVRNYVAKFSNHSVDAILNDIAERAMKQKQPGDELRALAGLLALDGQTTRSARFLDAANNATVTKQPDTMLASVNKP